MVKNFALYSGDPVLKSRPGDSFSVPRAKCWDSVLKQATPSSLDMLSNLSLTDHSESRCYIMCALKERR